MVAHLTSSKNEIDVIYLMTSFYLTGIVIYSFLRKCNQVDCRVHRGDWCW